MMKSARINFLLTLVIVLLYVGCEKGGAIKSPVEKFYTLLTSNGNQVNEKEVEEILSKALLEKFTNLVEAEDEIKKLDDKEFLTLFTSANTIPDGYEVKEFMHAHDQARMNIAFFKTVNQDTVKWADNLHLVQESGAWKIDNIVYGNKDRFKDLIARIENK